MQGIKGLSHITFICKDLEKTTVMFKYIFNAEEIYASNDKTFSIAKEKFFNIAGIWVAIMEGEAVEKTYNHVAFAIAATDLAVYEERIKDLNLSMLPSRPRLAAEGESIYFYDYDNHLFELHTGNLATRLNYYNKIVSGNSELND